MTTTPRALGWSCDSAESSKLLSVAYGEGWIKTGWKVGGFAMVEGEREE